MHHPRLACPHAPLLRCDPVPYPPSPRAQSAQSRQHPSGHASRTWLDWRLSLPERVKRPSPTDVAQPAQARPRLKRRRSLCFNLWPSSCGSECGAWPRQPASSSTSAHRRQPSSTSVHQCPPACQLAGLPCELLLPLARCSLRCPLGAVIFTFVLPKSQAPKLAVRSWAGNAKTTQPIPRLMARSGHTIITMCIPLDAWLADQPASLTMGSR